jgi:hypothetical protein
MYRASSNIASSGVAEARITADLERWFTALARSEPGHDLPGKHAEISGSDGQLDFSLESGSEVRPEALSAWADVLRSPHPRVEYRLAGLSIVEDDPEVYRVRFALERRAVDASGLDHIARSDETWRIRVAPSRAPVVFEIASVPRLAFPGTGPQIICY